MASEKKIVVVSRANYRGYAIFDMGNGYLAVQLGTKTISSKSLTALTLEIDKWLALKAN